MAGWEIRCAEIFPYSTHFKGSKSSVTTGSQNYLFCQKSETDNHTSGIIANGDLARLQELKI